MNRRVVNGIVLAIILLGAVGLISTLLSDPLWLLKQIAIYAAIAGIIYLVYRMVMKRKLGKEYSSYARAAKRSKRRFDDRSSRGSNVRNIAHAKKSTKTSAIKKKRQPSHLTVIEGKKGKKKNRAFF
ncbi:SA1362 family protein [uncultured Metabacillus sp.]|uniref:SA1362 family protein n=1 Tax=Metabacillus sp. Hm71 TaxID=3450743 RepID=UPI00262638FD|nr:SA1362 family protein [uncultured Metabacillus sp.]